MASRAVVEFGERAEARNPFPPEYWELVDGLGGGMAVGFELKQCQRAFAAVSQEQSGVKTALERTWGTASGLYLRSNPERVGEAGVVDQRAMGGGV